MKNIIVQYQIDVNKYSDPTYNNLYPAKVNDYSLVSFQEYAEKYNCEFVRITEPKINYKHPTWERFDLWLDPHWTETYDQVMYVDTDVIALPTAKNIFEHGLRDDSFKAARYDRYRSKTKEWHIDNNKGTIFESTDPTVCKDVRFQTGCFIINKKCRDAMLEVVKKYREFDVDDGQVLNWMVMNSGVPYEDLDASFNIKWKGGPPATKNFLHCAGGKKHKEQSLIYDVLKKIWPTV